MHIRQPADAIDELAREARAGGRGIPGERQIDRGELHAVRIESRIARAGRLERPHEQAGDHHQHDADRDLRDDECVPQTQTRRGLRVVFQRRHHVGFRCLQRRDEA